MVKVHDSYFAFYKKIFDKIFAWNLVCRLELAFPYFFYRKIRENRMFLRFFSGQSMFASFFVYISNMFKISMLQQPPPP